MSTGGHCQSPRDDNLGRCWGASQPTTAVAAQGAGYPVSDPPLRLHMPGIPQKGGHCSRASARSRRRRHALRNAPHAFALSFGGCLCAAQPSSELRKRGSYPLDSLVRACPALARAEFLGPGRSLADMIAASSNYGLGSGFCWVRSGTGRRDGAQLVSQAARLLGSCA